VSEQSHASGPVDPERTGIASVDQVLDSLAALDQAPLSEHVAVFESAHDRLLAALAADPGDARATPPAPGR
jgi:hypothetical protein